MSTRAVFARFARRCGLLDGDAGAATAVGGSRRRRRAALVAVVGAALLLVAAAGLAVRTAADLLPLPESLDGVPTAGVDGRALQVLDRNGVPLNATYANEWNVHDRVALYDVPGFLREAFVVAEDKRFRTHGGVDWRARASAVVSNVGNGRAVRGASTISEQVVRMLHPRPRTAWSKWLEGFEAARLEERFTKDEILEFYLNQVPYASNRRGVRQAARHYFARDLGTLSRKEMLALAVLVRAPSRFDLLRGTAASGGAIERLATALVERGTLTDAERAALLAAPFALESPALAVAAPHFVQHVRNELAARPGLAPAARVTTTLDARLQATVQRLLDERLRHFAGREAVHGAVLVADHGTGEVLAWVVGGGGNVDGPATYIDAVLTPRQPGSALKPFLYALALERGATAATVIDDAPLTESTSGGLHSYQNYSRRFYGPVTVREALGNSLNIPALKTLQSVGAGPYLATLGALGFAGLGEHPDHYGDGIALGNGPVTLLELVQAYAALGKGGTFRPLTVLRDDPERPGRQRVFSPETTSLVANILADADARALEFGRDSVLAFPVETAVKTGTSSDFRDAWAVGFDHRHAVGVWIGNLDQRPSDGLTGSTGPALVLRSVFAELTRGSETRPLYLSRRLERREVCVPRPDSLAAEGGCVPRQEWFAPGTGPAFGATAAAPAPAPESADVAVRFRQPTHGLHLAYDPRVPADAQAFEFQIDGVKPGDRVSWIVDGKTHATDGGRFRWAVARGTHEVAAVVERDGIRMAELAAVPFVVK